LALPAERVARSPRDSPSLAGRTKEKAGSSSGTGFSRPGGALATSLNTGDSLDSSGGGASGVTLAATGGTSAGGVGGSEASGGATSGAPPLKSSRPARLWAGTLGTPLPATVPIWRSTAYATRTSSTTSNPWYGPRIAPAQPNGMRRESANGWFPFFVAWVQLGSTTSSAAEKQALRARRATSRDFTARAVRRFRRRTAGRRRFGRGA
jgi:hypothetical protein